MTRASAAGSQPSLYGFNILTKFPKKPDLVQYLKQLHADLAELEQDVQKAPRGLQTTITHLISPKVLESPDKEVRVLAACCVVDVLRIYAPEAPYRDADMVRVYEMLIAQLRGLETHDAQSALGEKMAYILQSLASVKSCVVPVIMTQNNVPGASDVLASLFESVISAARPEHSKEILINLSEILHACIEEYEDVNEELLDLLLRPLLPANKTNNPTAYEMVAIVLRAVAPLIQKTLGEIVRKILLGSTSRLQGHISDEISEEIYHLIFELHKIAPNLLADIFPSLVARLQVEEEDIRHKAVKLLSSLFASKSAEYAKEFPRDLKDFLSRLNDRSLAIRSDVLDCCGVLLKNRRGDVTIVEEMVAKRLRDPDENLRSRALKKLLDYSLEHIGEVSAQTIHEMAERARDKKIEIRTLALDGLARLYYRHVSSQLPPLSAVHCDSGDSLESAIAGSLSVSQAVVDKLSMVPGVILKAWGFPDMHTRHVCVRLLQEYLLPKPVKQTQSQPSSQLSFFEEEKGEDSQRDGKQRESRSRRKSRPSVSLQAIDELSDQRATALLVLFRSLDETDKLCLASLLSMKSKVHDALSLFLRCKEGHAEEQEQFFPSSSSSSSSSPTDAATPVSLTQSQTQAMKLALTHITQQLPPLVDRRTLSLDTLLSMKDRNVFRLLTHCASTKESLSLALTHRDDLSRRCESKSALGEYVSMLYDVAGFLFCNNAMAEALLDLLLALAPSLSLPAKDAVEKERDVILVGEVLSLLSRFFPRLFSTSSPHLIVWLKQSLSMRGGTEREKERESQRRGQVFDSFCAMTLSCARYLEDERRRELVLALANAIEREKDASICGRCAEVLNQLVFCSVTHTQTPTNSQTEGETEMETQLLDDAQSLVRRLCAPSSLSAHHPRISHALQALFSLCVISPHVYESLSLLRRCAERMLHTFRPVQQTLLDFLQFDALGSDETEDAVKMLSLKLWTQLLCLDCEHYIFRHRDKKEARRREKEIEKANEIEEATKTKSKNKNNSNKGKKKGKKEEPVSSSATQSESRETDDDEPNYEPLSRVIFECLSARGGVLSGLHVLSEESQSDVYFSTTLCALQLMRIRSFGERIAVTQWQELAWALAGVDTQRDKAARKTLLSSLVSLIQTHPVHIKFLTFPCLFATDSDREIVDLAQRGLVFALRRLRKTQEELGARVAAEQDLRRREKYVRTAANTMPEMVLPFLLHLLSYHPEFPSSIHVEDEEDKRKMKSIIRIVQVLLSALQSTLRIETGNLPYLFKVLNTINRSYVDKLDPENIGLHFVTRLTVKILNAQVRTAENLQEYPGAISLPLDLYAHVGIEGLAQKQFGESVQTSSASVLEGLQIAEKAIDKILQIAGKEKGTRIAPSPAAKKRALIEGEKKRATRPRALSLDVDENEERRGEREQEKASEDEESVEAPLSKQRRSTDGAAKRGKSKKSISAADVEPVAPSRVLPRRSVKAAVASYEEKEEDEAEVLQWHEQAGQQRRSSRTSGSISKRPQSISTSPVRLQFSPPPSSSTALFSESPALSPMQISSPPTAQKKRKERSIFEELEDEDNEDVFESLAGKKRKSEPKPATKERTSAASTNGKTKSTKSPNVKKAAAKEIITDDEEEEKLQSPKRRPRRSRATEEEEVEENEEEGEEEEEEEEETKKSKPARKFSSRKPKKR